MSNPYLGEIRMFAGNFAPYGWALCNGQTLSISQNTALFSLLGTTYGGNCVSTFNLPDLRGRVAIHPGQGPGLSSYVEGQQAGVENVTLLINQIPSHNHTVNAVASGGNQASPAGGSLAIESTGTSLDYANSSTNPTSPMNAAMLSQTGGNQPHSNIQPYLCVNFIIALQGIYPSRN
jgi:microcystin-dependent protein